MVTPIVRFQRHGASRCRQRIYVPAFYPPQGTMTLWMGAWKGKERMPVTGPRTDGQNRIRVTPVRLFPPPAGGK